MSVSLSLVFIGPAASARTVPAGAATGVRLHASASAADPAVGTWPILRQGVGNSPVAVRSLHYLLDAHGAGLILDGIFGPRTNAAVRTYQGSHGLVVDGIVGPQTWQALIGVLPRG